ncbi:hypothetical protein DFJ74DRAFT_736325 [Hyaloraphidium curvatum]|nr:hypothetical protein DFJ74DRAFT_736325 [Hyaloraphidium curvatum]
MLLAFFTRLLSLRRWPPLALFRRIAALLNLLPERRRHREGLLSKDKHDDQDDDESTFSLSLMSFAWLAGLLFAFFAIRGWLSPALPPILPGDAAWAEKLFPAGVPNMVIVTPVLFPKGAPEHVERTLANHEAYAQRHGYGRVVLSEDMVPHFAHADEMVARPRHPVWYKITGAMFVLRALRAAEGRDPAKRTWLWLLDSDTVFTNMSMSFFDALPELKERPRRWETVLSKDMNGLNAGSWIVAADGWSELLLDRVWKNEVTGSLFREQEALKQIYANDANVGYRFLIVAQHRINAYPADYWNMIDSRNSRPWKPGDYIVHFPNCDGQPPPRPNCTERTRYYLLSDAERVADDQKTGRADRWEMQKAAAAMVAKGFNLEGLLPNKIPFN